MKYFLPFLISFIISIAATLLIRRYALSRGIVDKPGLERKIHTKEMPLLGGLAIILSFLLVIAGYAVFTDQLITGYFLPMQFIGIVLGSLIVMAGGYLDDRYDLRPAKQILFPAAASILAISLGVRITGITNPFAGGTIHFNFGLGIAIISFIWLMGMMYTTKYLDGLDGLVSGVGLIAALIMFVVAKGPTLMQDNIALLAIILAGSLAGFLIFNFHPASIFLGESGSLFVGFIIGILAIISGSKIATALLVLGIPILDVIWVIGRRWYTGRDLTIGDKMHLHHRLLAVGLSHRDAVLLIYLLTLLFGLTAVFLQTLYKLYVLGALVLFMIFFASFLVYLYNKKKIKNL